MAVDGGLSKTENLILKVAGISAALLALFNAYSFYKNNLWHPDVIVDSVDFDRGIANLTIEGRPFVLRGDSSYLIGYDWGIKFGYTFLPSGKRVYDRIEILKRNLVHEVIREGEIRK